MTSAGAVSHFQVLHQIGTPGRKGCGVAHDGTRLWHSDEAAQAIFELDPLDGAVLGAFQVPGVRGGLACDGQLLWSGTSIGGPNGRRGALVKIDPRRGAIIQVLNVSASGVACDGGHLWVGAADRPEIQRIDPATGAVVATIPAASAAVGGIAFDGRSVWHATAGGAPGIYRIDPMTGAVIGRFGAGAADLGWDGSSLWVVWQNERRLVKVAPAA